MKYFSVEGTVLDWETSLQLYFLGDLRRITPMGFLAPLVSYCICVQLSHLLCDLDLFEKKTIRVIFLTLCFVYPKKNIQCFCIFVCLQFVQSLDKCCNCQLSLLSLSYLLTVLSVQCNPWMLGLIIPSSVNILLCELCCASNSLCVFFLRRPWLRWNIHWQWGRHYFPQLAQQL